MNSNEVNAPDNRLLRSGLTVVGDTMTLFDEVYGHTYFCRITQSQIEGIKQRALAPPYNIEDRSDQEPSEIVNPEKESTDWADKLTQKWLYIGDDFNEMSPEQRLVTANVPGVLYTEFNIDSVMHAALDGSGEPVVEDERLAVLCKPGSYEWVGQNQIRYHPSEGEEEILNLTMKGSQLMVANASGQQDVFELVNDSMIVFGRTSEKDRETRNLLVGRWVPIAEKDRELSKEELMKRLAQEGSIPHLCVKKEGIMTPSDSAAFLRMAPKDLLLFTLMEDACYTLLDGKLTLFSKDYILPVEHLYDVDGFRIDPEFFKGTTVILHNNASLYVEDFNSVEWMSFSVDEEQLEIYTLEYGQRTVFYRMDEELAEDESMTDIAPDQTPVSYTDE